MVGAALEHDISSHPDLLALASSSESRGEQKVSPFVFAIGGTALNDTIAAIEIANFPHVYLASHEPDPERLAHHVLTLAEACKTPLDEQRCAIVVPLPQLPNLIPTASVPWPANYRPNPSYHLIDPLTPILDAAIDTSSIPGQIPQRYGLATTADPDQVIAALAHPEPLRYQKAEHHKLTASFGRHIGMFTLTRTCVGNIYAFNNRAGAMYAQATELGPDVQTLTRVPFPPTATDTTRHVSRTSVGNRVFDISYPAVTTSMALATNLNRLNS